MDLAQQILQKNDIKEKQVIIHRAAGRVTVVCGMRIESSVAQRRKWHEKMIFTPPSLPSKSQSYSLEHAMMTGRIPSLFHYNLHDFMYELLTEIQLRCTTDYTEK